MKTVVYSVLIHSCQLDFSERLRQYLIPGERYIFVGNGYRILPKRCRCKKQVTKTKAEQLVADGIAEPVWKTRCRRVQIDFTRIWMAQQVQVPRVDLISPADIDRFVDFTVFGHGGEESAHYIEEVHALYVENRKKLTVEITAEEYDRQERLDYGVPVVYSYTDFRTPGGISK
jgi:hypothetical protein